MSKYYILEPEQNMDNCVIDGIPDEMPDKHCPALGIKMGDSYSGNIEFRFADDFPGLVLTDLLQNCCGYTMVSKRLKNILEENTEDEIEFLRFTLLNHKGRVASDDVYIANVIGTVDCMDKVRTMGEVSSFRPERYDFIESLYLNEEKINPGLKIFRITSFPRIIIVSEDLKNILVEQGITGMDLLEMGAVVNLEG